MSEHTEGPWKIWQGSREIFADSDHVCTMQDLKGGKNCVSRIEEYRANASLIAAAPDLLEACKVALPCISHIPIHAEDVAFIEQAIAKATK